MQDTNTKMQTNKITKIVGRVNYNLNCLIHNTKDVPFEKKTGSQLHPSIQPNILNYTLKPTNLSTTLFLLKERWEGEEG